MLLLSIWNLTLPQRSINDRCKRLRDNSSTVFKKTRWNVIQANGFLGLKPFKLKYLLNALAIERLSLEKLLPIFIVGDGSLLSLCKSFFTVLQKATLL